MVPTIVTVARLWSVHCSPFHCLVLVHCASTLQFPCQSALPHSLAPVRSMRPGWHCPHPPWRERMNQMSTLILHSQLPPIRTTPVLSDRAIVLAPTMSTLMLPRRGSIAQVATLLLSSHPSPRTDCTRHARHIHVVIHPTIRDVLTPVPPALLRTDESEVHKVETEYCCHHPHSSRVSTARPCFDCRSTLHTLRSCRCHVRQHQTA